MYQTKAEVLAKEEVGPGLFILKLFSEKITEDSKPGQFVNIKCGDDHSFILRRPFSIHRLLGRGTFEILFEVRGRGTLFLSQVEMGSFLDIIGPLGEGFKPKEGLRRAVTVAGGLGIVPLMFLNEELSRKKVKIEVLFGAKTREKLFYSLDLKRMVHRAHFATDDGSFGYKGEVTDLLAGVIEEAEPEQIFACGPLPMLKKVADICDKEEIPCQVALEAQMACGIGACLSCVCPVRENGKMKYERTCFEGPVFEAERIAWEKLIL